MHRDILYHPGVHTVARLGLSVYPPTPQARQGGVTDIVGYYITEIIGYLFDIPDKCGIKTEQFNKVLLIADNYTF